MKVTRFDRNDSLIIVRGWVWGPHGRRRNLRLALDTASTQTILTPDILDDLGYSPRHGETNARVGSVIGDEEGYYLRVARFRALGHEVADFRVAAHDFSEGDDLDGLLGLSFLRQFNCEIRFAEGKIVVDRI